MDYHASGIVIRIFYYVVEKTISVLNGIRIKGAKILILGVTYKKDVYD